MKEVLIPVDFTEESSVAISYGIDLANHLEANVRIVHVKTNKVIVPFFSNDRATDTMSQDVGAWAEQLYNKFKSTYKVECGQFDYKIREGNIVDEICNQAKYGDSTIMVVGSHNNTAFESKWVGSPAYRLVAHSPCPVLVVNKRMQLKHNINKIALPIDYGVASRKKVPEIAGVAHLFDATVHVVGLKSSNLEWMNKEMKSYVHQVVKFVSEKAHVEVDEVVLTGKDYAKTLMEFADGANVDLITTHVHHSINPFVLLYQSFTNELINKSLKPVLVIPTKD